MLQNPRRLICLAIFVFATPALLFAQDSQHEGSAEARELAITGATLIDGTGAGPRSATTIFVRNGRIAAVSPDADTEVPAGVREIDAAGKYVIPGLADMHFHLSPPDGPLRGLRVIGRPAGRHGYRLSQTKRMGNRP